MATTTEIVPFTPPTEDRTDEAVSGEVITPEEELKANERIIKKGYKVFQQKAAEVYRALTIIHTKNLWKQHLDAEGKRKYNSFEKYLEAEFDWKLDRTRALQIIKEQRTKLLADGTLTASDMPAERKRTAPEVTPTKAAQVTMKQLQGVLDAFKDRLTNIANGPGADYLDTIYDDLVTTMLPVFDSLRQVISDEVQYAADAVAANAAEVAERDAPESEDDASESEDEEAAPEESAPEELSPLRVN